MSSLFDDHGHERSILPEHPLPRGGRLPALNLAAADGFNVASGSGIQSMPDPEAPALSSPTLQGSPMMGGIDPQAPIPVLNLAGVEGVPFPAQLVGPSGPDQLNRPDFGQPNLSQPMLQSADPAQSGLNATPNAQWSPDPLLPDRTAYHHPYGLDVWNQGHADLSAPDLLIGIDADLPQGLSLLSDPQQPDPLLPDLQHPSTHVMSMTDRPGDLAPSALEQMHQSPLYQQLGNVPYTHVFLDQSGLNSHQRRHYDLLMQGLDAVEHDEK